MLHHAKKTLLVATCLLLAAPAVRSQVLWTETFTAPTLDPLRWSVVTQGVPFGNSAVTVQNGECVLQNRGHLVSVQQFNPAQTGYRVTCRWRWTDGNDRFQMLVRSDGVPDPANYGETTNGIQLHAGMEGGSSTGLSWRGSQLTLGPTAFTGPGVNYAVGVWYSAQIRDLGSTVEARVDGPNGQWLGMLATVLADSTAQKKLVFHNRENTLGSHQCFLDDVVVSLLADWRQLQSPASPYARYGMGLVFDEWLGEALLFGGSGNGSMNSETWAHNGFAWHLLAPTQSPPSRFGFAMVHDSTRNQNALFGGWNGSVRLNDTWVWSAGNWQQANPAGPVPPASDNHCGAFDRNRGRMVIFGGVDDQSASLNDTWEWDGTQWHCMPTPTHPAGRGYASMCFDQARGKTVLFGGYDQSGVHFNDTWLWDGSSWVQANPATSPGPRNSAHVAYDSRREVVVLGGGVQSGTWLADTWQWDGTNWNLIVYPTNPPGRWYAGAAYNRVRGHLLTFGGIASPGSGDPAAWLNQTWVLEPSRLATYEPFGTGCMGPNGTTPLLSAPAGSAPRIGSTSTLRVSNLPLGVVCLPILVLGVSNEFDTGPLGTYLLPLDLGILGWPGCQQLVSISDTLLAITNTGQADHTVTIPALPVLVGMQFHAQAFVLYDPSGVAVSNGITGTAGY